VAVVTSGGPPPQASASPLLTPGALTLMEVPFVVMTPFCGMYDRAKEDGGGR